MKTSLLPLVKAPAPRPTVSLALLVRYEAAPMHKLVGIAVDLRKVAPAAVRSTTPGYLRRPPRSSFYDEAELSKYMADDELIGHSLACANALRKAAQPSHFST